MRLALRAQLSQPLPATLAQRLPAAHRDHQESTRLRMLRFLDQHPQASSARCKAGHFTSSAFILREDGAALFLFHKKLQRWLQPGGHIEGSDRDPIEAARREAEEESGLSRLRLLATFPIDLDIHWIPARGTQRRHAHLDLRYLFLSEGGEEAQINHESEGLSWRAGETLTELCEIPSLGRALHVASLLIGDQSVMRDLGRL